MANHARVLYNANHIMNCRHTIAQAWLFTRENKKMMWWYAFVPSVLTTTVGIFSLLYQYFAFKRSPIFDNAPKSFLNEVISTTLDFFSAHGDLFVPTLVVGAIVLVLYLLLPTLMQAAMIKAIAQKKRGSELKIVEGFSLGMLSFLPLFEYNLLIKTFSLFSILTETAFIWRNLGSGAMKFLFPIVLLVISVGLVLTLLFTYADFFIVLDKKPILRAMGRSAKLVILSWQHTFLIVILMLIIGLRMVINILAVLLVPALLFFSVGFIASITLSTIGIFIGIVVSAIGLFVASYFSGVLHVFANTVWTFSFLELNEEKHTKEAMSE